MNKVIASHHEPGSCRKSGSVPAMQAFGTPQAGPVGRGFCTLVAITAFTWLLVFWLESNVGCRIKIRLEDDVDPQPVYGTVQSFLVSRHFRLESSTLMEGKRQLVFLLLIPSGLDPKQLEGKLGAILPMPEEARIDIQAI